MHFRLVLYYERTGTNMNLEALGGSQGYFLYYACITRANFKPGAGQEDLRGIFFLRLYYACTTRANFKPGAGQEDPRGTFCITLVI